MRIVIADDEPHLRAWLRRLLGELAPETQILAEAGNGREALMAIEALCPDVAFLDIRMPELSGLEVAARLSGVCHVVFVTAYDEFAVQAFEQAAIDYLVKPVTPERLQKTLQRMERIGTAVSATSENSATPTGDQEIMRNASDTLATLQSLISRLNEHDAPVTGKTLRWLRVGNDDAVHLLDIQEVDCFKAADKYTEAHCNGRVWLVRTPLGELESSLDLDEFWRIHRSIIVRVGAIKEARRDLMGRLAVHLHSGAPALPVSRSHAHLFNRH